MEVSSTFQKIANIRCQAQLCPLTSIDFRPNADANTRHLCWMVLATLGIASYRAVGVLDRSGYTRYSARSITGPFVTVAIKSHRNKKQRKPTATRMMELDHAYMLLRTLELDELDACLAGPMRRLAERTTTVLKRPQDSANTASSSTEAAAVIMSTTTVKSSGSSSSKSNITLLEVQSAQLALRLQTELNGESPDESTSASIVEASATSLTSGLSSLLDGNAHSSPLHEVQIRK